MLVQIVRHSEVVQCFRCDTYQRFDAIISNIRRVNRFSQFVSHSFLEYWGKNRSFAVRHSQLLLEQSETKNYLTSVCFYCCSHCIFPYFLHYSSAEIFRMIARRFVLCISTSHKTHISVTVRYKPQSIQRKRKTVNDENSNRD